MKNHVKPAVLCLILALLLLPWPSASAVQAEPAGREVTAECTYTLPEDRPVARLTDESLLTRLSVRGNRSLGVSLPDCENPSLYVTWFARPRSLTLVQQDAQGQQIQKTTVTPVSPFERYALESACRTVLLSSNETWTISTLRVFDGALPEDLIFLEKLPLFDAEGKAL